MADPVSAVMLGSMAINTIGGISQASAEKKAGQYNAKILRTNAAIKRTLAKDALDRGDRSEAFHRMEVADLKADQRARMLAGGQTITGSNSRMLDDTAFYGELDALTIRANAGKESWAYNVDAESLDMQAQLAEMGGTASSNATLLTTGAQLASQWVTYGS